MKFHKTLKLCIVLIFFTVIVAFNVYAAGLPWDDHGDPFDFRFYNNFDSHQQSKVNGGKNKLTGFLYIEFTVGTTAGLPDAKHGTETAGWVLDGLPVEGAVLIDNSGLHPIWCLDPEDIPRSPGYTHFHWTTGEEENIERGDLVLDDGYDGYLLKMTAIDSFFFEHGDFPITPGIDYDSHYNIVIAEGRDGCLDYQ